MGLDMYLYKRHYIEANYEHRNVTGNVEIKIGDKPVKIDFKKISSITENAGYWRKANHIHAWFVANVQKGVDDCGDYDVSQEQLEKLLSDCKAVLASKGKKEVAEEVMPTKGGFFFGGTDYDEYYYKDCEETIAIVEAILKEKTPEGYLPFDVIYSSSW